MGPQVLVCSGNSLELGKMNYLDENNFHSSLDRLTDFKVILQGDNHFNCNFANCYDFSLNYS